MLSKAQKAALKLENISNEPARYATEQGISNLMRAGINLTGINLVENDSAFATSGVNTTGGGLVANVDGKGGTAFGPGTSGAQGNSISWFPIALALNRRVSPTHIGNEICETIPLDRPYGMAFARRVIYDGFDMSNENVQKAYRQGLLEADWRVSDIYSGYSGGLGNVTGRINKTTGLPTADGTGEGISAPGASGNKGTQGVSFVPIYDAVTGKITKWQGSDGKEYDTEELQNHGKGMEFADTESWRIRNWGALAQDIASGKTPPDATGDLPAGTATAGFLGNSGLGRTGITGQLMPQLKYILDKRSIQCNTRKLSASFTQEDAMLLQGLHGLDIQVEMINILHKETLTEIDRELLGAAAACALDVDNEGGSAGIVDLGEFVGDQRQVTSIVAGVILFAAATVGKRTLMSTANKVIVSPSIYALLSQATPYFTKVEGKFDGLALSGAEVKKVGTLNGMIDVFVDPFARDTNYALVAYKGKATGEAGVIYSPYLMNVTNIGTNYENWNLNAGVVNTYAITPNLLGSGNYYRLVIFDHVNEAAGFVNSLLGWV